MALPRIPPVSDESLTFASWIASRIEAEPYWFHRIELAPGVITPGWSDPAREKLPHFGLPADLSGQRVLDVGCAEGFFSFEAERRGAAEVIAIDPFPDSIRRFLICRDALGSTITPFLCSVYDLSPRKFGTFDLVMCFGVLYHLRHPILALERLNSVTTGQLLLQTACADYPSAERESWAQFHPFGVESGPPERRTTDPTVFWLPTRGAVLALLAHVGFEAVETVSNDPSISIAVRARAAQQARSEPPDQRAAPWS